MATAIGNHLSRTTPPNPLPTETLSFAAFKERFSLDSTTTEKGHPLTANLSQIMQDDIEEGLRLLRSVDKNVIMGLHVFTSTAQTAAKHLSENLIEGGRVFLVGSGTSGRIALDIAAKSIRGYVKHGSQVIGVLSGGDAALVKPKEGFEDSGPEGEKALASYQLTKKDTVILISASGSATFNVGCGHFAANAGAQVHYFHNSTIVPEHTEALFIRKKNPVTRWCVDKGPEPIDGSARLTSATLASVALGGLVGTALAHSVDDEIEALRFYPSLITSLEQANTSIDGTLKDCKSIIEKAVAVFSSPCANFRRTRDETNQGYVTYLMTHQHLTVYMDATEAAPTYSTNPPRGENELTKKRAEFQAYVLDLETVGRWSQSNNERISEAWQTMLRRPVNPNDVKDAFQFLVGVDCGGVDTYYCRPTGKGNLVIGVCKLDDTHAVPKRLDAFLSNSASKGGDTALIAYSHDTLSFEEKERLKSYYPSVVILDDIPRDSLGLIASATIKQTLNLISNGAMIMMGKVIGSTMIDVRVSNGKLIARAIRIIQKFLPDIEEETLYHYVVEVHKLMKQREEQGIYTPSASKIVISMLQQKKGMKHFEEVCEELIRNNEIIKMTSH